MSDIKRKNDNSDIDNCTCIYLTVLKLYVSLRHHAYVAIARPLFGDSSAACIYFSNLINYFTIIIIIIIAS